MIIDRYGNRLQAWYRADGNLIHDSDNPYNIKFAIGVPYTGEEKSKYIEKKELKNYLKNTDYKAIKYSEGYYTEEEYAPIKAERAWARERINEIEFEEPTLTRAEMDAAEKKAMDDLAEEQRLIEEQRKLQEEYEKIINNQMQMANEVAQLLEKGEVNEIHVVSNDEFQSIIGEEEENADS